MKKIKGNRWKFIKDTTNVGTVPSMGNKLIYIMVFMASIGALFGQEFNLVSENGAAPIIIDAKDASVVQIAAELLAKDLYSVTGKKTEVAHKLKSNHGTAIIAGTVGSKYIDQLALHNKINIAAIEGKWESYSIQWVANPLKQIKEAVVVVGSDRRATAYGLLELSRMIGVSPWEWWADVVPEKKDNIVLSIKNKIYGSPSIKYRGIFLNDEDWGLQRWAALNYEPETGDIGPKTYAKVFELLLRLRANTIWPAMHSSTKPFYSYPKNKEVADDYAIVVGTSHAEPMLSNINTEWDHKTMGEYRYDTNAETIKGLFKKRVRETANFEGIYTVGMRGEHDSPMIVGDDDTQAQVKLLEQVITDQREILKKGKKKNIEDIPQAFVPYKEVLTYYQNGLQLPEDISLIWTDDNYGYIRQLSNTEEQERVGGAGIYYHTSYWGRPHDYLWLNSTNPVLMWEEMSKAYEFGSKDLWILNCGDIKPHEYSIELFLDMGWDMDRFKTDESVKTHMQDWAGREFGPEIASEVTQLLYGNNRLAYIRRPEFMAWSQVEPVTKAGKTELTQFHYGDEVSKRIMDYQNLIDRSESLYKKIAVHRKDAFYQLIHYPVIGAAHLNQKWLYAFKNEFTARQGRQSAVHFGEKSVEAYRKIRTETEYYNTVLQNGKWNHIMNMSPRYLPVFSQPIVAKSMAQQESALGLALESYEMEANQDAVNSFTNVLPVFNAYTNNRFFIDVYLKGEEKIDWKAVPKADWIKISETEGALTADRPEQRLWVTLDWEKVPKGENKKEAPLGHDYQLIPPSYKINSAIEFRSGDKVHNIGISAYNPKFEALDNYNGFVEDRGFVSINAEQFTRKQKGSETDWEVFEGLGYTGKVITALPRTAAPHDKITNILANSPVLEYDFHTFNFGEADVRLQVVPTHAPHSGRGVRFAVAIDDAKPVILDFQTFGRSDEWKQNVLKNAAVKSAKQIVNRAGKHTLKIWMVDPGVMLDRILIDLGGWKRSYAFPSQTKK